MIEKDRLITSIVLRGRPPMQSRLEMNPDHDVRAHFPSRRRGNRFRQKAIDKNAAAIFDGQKQPGVGARRAQRRPDLALGEIHRFTGNDVRGDDAERHLQLAEVADGA